MSLSLPKLQRLWKNPPASSDDLSDRCGQIETIVKRWDDSQAAPLSFTPAKTSEEEGYPTNNWNQVKSKFDEYYNLHDPLRCLKWQIDDVSNLFHVQRRDARFRVSSNAGGMSDFESPTTTPTQGNPESFFVSYNFPFQIVDFYHGCKTGTPTDRLSWVLEKRFYLKFLWMLANRGEHLPVLSLHSFRELASLYPDVVGNLEELTLQGFAMEWPKVSKKLCQEITDTTFADLPSEQKQRLWRLLFQASVQTTSAKNAFDMLRTGNQALILYGPPGTGKTYHARQVAEQMFFPSGARPANDAFQAQKFTTLFPVENASAQVRIGCWDLVQFHPSYSYQDFMGGILPSLDSGSLSYKLDKGLFMRFCETAALHPEIPFVLIIDEINRADLSSVFGELMYALEYRCQPVQVPHFGSFSIPENVYLIGTMNTADKSLVSFDLALRRRFTFLRLAPDLECLADWGLDRGFSERAMGQVIERAKALNTWLTDSREGLGRSAELAIGQAYFMKIADFCPADENDEKRTVTSFALEQLWDYHLEPLIEEYLGAEVETHQANLEKHRKAFTATLQIED